MANLEWEHCRKNVQAKKRGQPVSFNTIILLDMLSVKLEELSLEKNMHYASNNIVRIE